MLSWRGASSATWWRATRGTRPSSGESTTTSFCRARRRTHASHSQEAGLDGPGASRSLPWPGRRQGGVRGGSYLRPRGRIRQKGPTQGVSHAQFVVGRGALFSNNNLLQQGQRPSLHPLDDVLLRGRQQPRRGQTLVLLRRVAKTGGQTCTVCIAYLMSSKAAMSSSRPRLRKTD